MKQLRRKDILLALLFSPSERGGEVNQPICGRTRLAKMFFLFKKEVWPKLRLGDVIPEQELPEFYAWRFGPFSKEVYSDIDFFRSIGFLETTEIEAASDEEAMELAHWLKGTDGTDANEYREECFVLSGDGQRYVREKGLWEALNEEQRHGLADFKKRMVNAPLYAIISYVYRKYPETTSKSEIRESVLGG